MFTHFYKALTRSLLIKKNYQELSVNSDETDSLPRKLLAFARFLFVILVILSGEQLLRGGDEQAHLCPGLPVQSTSRKIVMQVMSSMTVSFSFHFCALARTMALPACSGLFLM